MVKRYYSLNILSITMSQNHAKDVCHLFHLITWTNNPMKESCHFDFHFTKNWGSEMLRSLQITELASQRLSLHLALTIPRSVRLTQTLSYLFPWTKNCTGFWEPNKHTLVFFRELVCSHQISSCASGYCREAVGFGQKGLSPEKGWAWYGQVSAAGSWSSTFYLFCFILPQLPEDFSQQAFS